MRCSENVDDETQSDWDNEQLEEFEDDETQSADAVDDSDAPARALLIAKEINENRYYFQQ